MKKVLKKTDVVDYNFTLVGFSGPLDLLLHLARSNEIEISTLSLDTLIDQYLIFIENVQENGVNIASTYLEMAAELIRLKSKTLLPNHQDDGLEFLDELEGLGLNREELIAKLIEYKKYKEAAGGFEALIEQRFGYFTRTPERMLEYRSKSFKKSLDLAGFSSAAENYMKIELGKKSETRQIEHHDLSSDDYIAELKENIKNFKFYERIQNLSKPAILALFLAILEALKLQYISFVLLEDDILITNYLKENDDKGN